MYSPDWFDTFASAIPLASTAAEADAVCAFAPPAQYPRLLEIGCGTGRLLHPLVMRGYDVTGIDTSWQALAAARRVVPAATLIALDQRDIAALRARFDVIAVFWNSTGFGSRTDDLLTLGAVRQMLRPGGLLLLDLYHPGWLAAHQQVRVHDSRGATISRWLEAGRCHHEIVYASGHTDRISFNVYTPAEMRELLVAARFDVRHAMTWWDRSREPGPEHARYQLVCG